MKSGMRLALLMQGALAVSKSQSELQHILEGKMSIPLSLQAIQRPGEVPSRAWEGSKRMRFEDHVGEDVPRGE